MSMKIIVIISLLVKENHQNKELKWVSKELKKMKNAVKDAKFKFSNNIEHIDYSTTNEEQLRM